MINKPNSLNRDYNRDPSIKALRRRAFSNRWLHMIAGFDGVFIEKYACCVRRRLGFSGVYGIFNIVVPTSG